MKTILALALLAGCDAAKTISVPMKKLSTEDFLKQHRAMLANAKAQKKNGDTGSVTVKDYSNAQVKEGVPVKSLEKKGLYIFGVGGLKV